MQVAAISKTVHSMHKRVQQGASAAAATAAREAALDAELLAADDALVDDDGSADAEDDP